MCVWVILAKGGGGVRMRVGALAHIIRTHTNREGDREKERDKHK